MSKRIKLVTQRSHLTQCKTLDLRATEGLTIYTASIMKYALLFTVENVAVLIGTSHMELTHRFEELNSRIVM